MGRDNRKNNRGGRGWGKSDNNKKKSTKDKPSKRKNIGDYIYHIGSAKQASDYVTVTSYIINYIRRTLPKGEDIARALETEKELDLDSLAPVMKISTKTDAEEKAREERQFDKEFKILYNAHTKRRIAYEDNRSSVAATLWNQCSSAMKAKVKSRPEYDAIKGDPIKLLQAIRQHALSYESSQFRMKTICESLKSFVNLKQRDDEDATDYLDRFKAASDVLLSHVGKSFHFPKLVEEHPDYQILAQASILASSATATNKQVASDKIKSIQREVMDEFYGYLYLENANKSRYGSIQKGMDTHYVQRKDETEKHQYPKDLQSAQEIIRTHRYDPGYKDKKKNKQKEEKNASSNKDKDEDNIKLSFTQMKSTCYCCGCNHKLTDCPDKMTKPKDEWHINKAKEAKQFQGIVKEIEKMMNHHISTSSTQSASASVATNDDA